MKHIFRRVHHFCLEMSLFTLPFEFIWNTFFSESTTLPFELIWNTFFAGSTIFAYKWGRLPYLSSSFETHFPASPLFFLRNKSVYPTSSAHLKHIILASPPPYLWRSYETHFSASPPFFLRNWAVYPIFGAHLKHIFQLDHHPTFEAHLKHIF